MADKKPQQRKPNLSPEAAKVLEQYRNAGKSKGSDGAAPEGSDQTAKPDTSAHVPPLHRSGTRGK